VITDAIEITGVDVERTDTQDAVPAPQVEIDDINIHHADPAPIEVAPTQEEPRTETPAPVALPARATALCRSTRVKSQMNQGYKTSLSGSKFYMQLRSSRAKEFSILIRTCLCKMIFIKFSRMSGKPL
jgi:hypothetical protein